MRLPYPVVLASQSPRRRELLATIVPEFEVLAAGIEEDAFPLPDPWQTAGALSRAKARDVAQLRPEALVIGGDTVVAVPIDEGYEQLAKPSSPGEAVSMLMTLSGRGHLVITGVCIAWPGGEESFVETSQVFFPELPIWAVKDYVATGSPLDKAGAYGIQDPPIKQVARVEGSVSNVVGLPVEALERHLARITR